jgi:hypothetical protein
MFAADVSGGALYLGDVLKRLTAIGEPIRPIGAGSRLIREEHRLVVSALTHCDERRRSSPRQLGDTVRRVQVCARLLRQLLGFAALSLKGQDCRKLCCDRRDLSPKGVSENVCGAQMRRRPAEITCCSPRLCGAGEPDCELEPESSLTQRLKFALVECSSF